MRAVNHVGGSSDLDSVQPFGGWLRRFFVRQDPVYEQYAQVGQAKSPLAEVFYLAMHLLPGLTGWALINVPSIYRVELRITGVSGRYLQYAWLILITFGWHMALPLLTLRFHDGFSWRDCRAFVGLNRIDVRGLLLVLPVYCILFAIVALPYMRWVWNPLESVFQSIPGFQMPPYTIFKGGPDGLYAFPPVALAFLFIGNFLGEELYFRAYLMKKVAFLGRWAWIVNSLLFAVYHLWQIPQTWPLTGLVLAMGLLMQLRKDLYVLIAFHFFVNMWLAFGDYQLARIVHMAR